MNRRELLSSSDSDDDVQQINPHLIRRLPTFRDRTNFDFVSDFEFKERFRLTKHQVEKLLGEIGQHLQPKALTNHTHSARMKVLIALHWLGNGGQYHGIADMHGTSKKSVHRFVHEVVETICRHYFPKIVNFPENGQQSARSFYRYGEFPNVCGCVDGMLITIDSPNLNEADYVDRKGNHSINVMAVCGPSMEFFYVSARWGGSTNDARVLRNSTLARRFYEGWRPFPGAIILGDSGYPLLDWLIPPLMHNLDGDREKRFNRAHKKTRRLIDCAYGLIHEKFPALNHLRVQPMFACQIIKACTALHNLALEDDVVALPNGDENVEEEIIENINEENPEGIRRRNEIIELF